MLIPPIAPAPETRSGERLPTHSPYAADSCCPGTEVDLPVRRGLVTGLPGKCVVCGQRATVINARSCGDGIKVELPLCAKHGKVRRPILRTFFLLFLAVAFVRVVLPGIGLPVPLGGILLALFASLLFARLKAFDVRLDMLHFEPSMDGTHVLLRGSCQEFAELVWERNTISTAQDEHDESF